MSPKRPGGGTTARTGTSFLITGYRASRSSIYTGDTVDITVYLSRTDGSNDSIRVVRGLDSFQDGTASAVASGQNGEYTVTFTGLTYTGDSGKQLAFTIYYEGNGGGYQDGQHRPGARVRALHRAEAGARADAGNDSRAARRLQLRRHEHVYCRGRDEDHHRLHPERRHDRHARPYPDAQILRIASHHGQPGLHARRYPRGPRHGRHCDGQGARQDRVPDADDRREPVVLL